jgi:hypothetical protein
VGCATQSRLEIPIAPIDRPVNQVWFFAQHCFYRRQIHVTGNHETLDACRIELRMVLGKIRNIVG